MELLSLNIKKIQETVTPKKVPDISGNGNPKKASYISKNGSFQSTPKKFLIFQEMETTLKMFIFQEMEIPKKSLYFRKRNFLLYFRKQNFLIFRERYIQNSGIFKTRNIFRTLSNIYDETFCKNSYLAHFSASGPKTFPCKTFLKNPF